MNHKSKKRPYFKVIALLVVCLFFINNLAWAYPDFKLQPNNTHTLQAQSTFTPVLDLVDDEYRGQAEKEMQLIRKMVMRGEEFQDINAALDTAFGAPYFGKERRGDEPERIFDMKSNSYFAFWRGSNAGKGYRQQSTSC